MADQGQSGGGGQQGVTVVPVPDDQVQTVLKFIAGLQSDDDDVSGHMISGGGMIGGIGATMAVSKHATHTGCTQSQTGPGVDWSCSDTDTLIS